MKISTLNSKLNLLAVGTDAKTIKGSNETRITAIQYLASATISGYEACPGRSEACTNECLITAGRGAMTMVQQARIRKTKLYFEKPEEYFKLLNQDLSLLEKYGKDNGMSVYVRLNGTSDLDYLSTNIFNKYEDLKFYDYTKVKNRVFKKLPKNYKLTFSRDENTSEKEIKDIIKTKNNIAIVFDKVPTSYLNIPVIEGDLTDLRYEDPRGVIIGLKAKGKARKSTSGFVVKNQIPTVEIL